MVSLLKILFSHILDTYLELNNVVWIITKQNYCTDETFWATESVRNIAPTGLPSLAHPETLPCSDGIHMRKARLTRIGWAKHCQNKWCHFLIVGYWYWLVSPATNRNVICMQLCFSFILFIFCMLLRARKKLRGATFGPRAASWIGLLYSIEYFVTVQCASQTCASN